MKKFGLIFPILLYLKNIGLPRLVLINIAHIIHIGDNTIMPPRAQIISNSLFIINPNFFIIKIILLLKITLIRMVMLCQMIRG